MIEPLAWARIAPHHTCSPQGSSGEEASGCSDSPSIRWTHPNGGGPENAAMVPPRYHWPGSRRTTITFQRSLRTEVTAALPDAASRRPGADFCRRLPPHSTGQGLGQ